MNPPAPFAAERSARKSLVTWAMLLVGAVFVFAGFTVDPQTNCDASGRECAPWLVPLAAVMGLGLTAIATAQIVASPRRGYAMDCPGGDLVWWKNRTAHSAGDTGRIHPSQIARVRIDTRCEDTTLSLIGMDGERFAFFDEELVSWRCEAWAEKFTGLFPHIEIEVLE